ncbi:MAG: cysteine desulfurase [Aerococcus sp.]|nr:cysteine desulfurase [Aerococcus sp.]
MIYFDNSATTPIFDEAAQAMTQTMTRYFGNPSSLHRLGDAAHQLLETARRQVAELLGCEPQEVFFTSGGSESNNWAIKGTLLEKVHKGQHVITSAVEHPSVRETLNHLEQQGVEVTTLPVDDEGRVSADDLKQAIKPETVLVTVMAVNNEIGAIQPIEELAEVLEDYPTIHFHVDGVQSVGRFDWPLIHKRVDLMSFSAHKFNGPRGVGILYKKANRHIQPLIDGGGQEKGLRSTTENLAGIVATAKVLRLSLENAPQENETHRAIQAKLRQFLTAQGDKIRIFSPEEHGSPHVLCFALKGVRGEVAVHALEEHDIYVSTTSACSSRKVDKVSSTLQAMGVDGTWSRCAIRLSFGSKNTVAEAEEFIKIYQQLLEKFAKIQ